MLWIAWQIWQHRESGTREWGEPVERSQRTDKSPEGIETTQREGLLRRAEVSGQDCCKEDSLEKSPGEAEGREHTAETGNRGEDGT